MADRCYVGFKGDAESMKQIAAIAKSEQRSVGAQLRLIIDNYLEQYAEKRGEIDSEKGRQS